MADKTAKYHNSRKAIRTLKTEYRKTTENQKTSTRKITIEIWKREKVLSGKRTGREPAFPHARGKEDG